MTNVEMTHSISKHRFFGIMPRRALTQKIGTRNNSGKSVYGMAVRVRARKEMTKL